MCACVEVLGLDLDLTEKVAYCFTRFLHISYWGADHLIICDVRREVGSILKGLWRYRIYEIHRVFR